jgi:branched-chain amino acid transport system permease protein
MTARRWVGWALLLGLALAVPWLLRSLDADFYLSMASRIVVFAIAATTLNLLLGYGGMVSLGHAAFFGLGAYVSGVLLAEGVQGAGVHLLLTLGVCALAATLIGSISLRTRGVYFIMITLAFAQMLFYLANSIKGYGGDEGLTVSLRVQGPFGLDLHDADSFYYTALAVLVLVLVLLARFTASRLGQAVQALRDDEVRAEALGLPTFAVRLLVFVVAGAVAGLAGALSVNLQGYVSPNNLHWTQSGTLLVMVILGGAGSLLGGVLGAAALLLLQEGLTSYSEHGEFWTGWVLLAVVLFARHGLAGTFSAAMARWNSRAVAPDAGREAGP